MPRNILRLFFSLMICQLAGLAGSLFTAGSVNSWYPTLNKPFFNPPNWVFAPVWTFLFLLMGISLYLVLGAGGENRGKALSVFAIQLVLNVGWSAAFFGLKSPLAAFIVIIFLWAVILLTIREFRKIRTEASALLVPYLIWVSFAVFLNAGFLLLN
ncbi:MAG: tryptophan-rich sensory protein [Elusimicrobia bacterium]|nr:tryptophan-rich sensory protein [Elusimicrobiota bacterium]